MAYKNEVRNTFAIRLHTLATKDAWLKLTTFERRMLVQCMKYNTDKMWPLVSIVHLAAVRDIYARIYPAPTEQKQ